MSMVDNQPQPETPQSLAEVRQRIDRIDLDIQRLLNERAKVSSAVASIKLAEAAGQPVDLYHPEREAQLLKRIAERNDGPMAPAAVQRIFREIISASRVLEAPVRVAYLGPEGTFTHTATVQHFGHTVETESEPDIAEVFQSVEAGRRRFGVVPVENSIEGSVNQTLDQLSRTRLRVCGEVRLRIKHCLLSNASQLQDIQEVHAHPQALAQCWHWLNAKLPKAKRKSASSNAAAAKIVVGKPGMAAIAGEAAAELYGLDKLEIGIEDEQNNTTRFLVIGNQHVPPSGDDSTLLLMAAPHRPGGLRSMLEPLEKAGVSMTRIESRPSRSALWDYVFFIDVHGHELDANLCHVLDELKGLSPMLKVLGSYPRAL
ncbi:MAG: prephenate dehydratase [Granulosicoccus sp.]